MGITCAGTIPILHQFVESGQLFPFYIAFLLLLFLWLWLSQASNWIKRLKAKGCTNAQIAGRVGVEPRTIQRWASGETKRPQLAMLKVLQKLLEEEKRPNVMNRLVYPSHFYYLLEFVHPNPVALRDLYHRYPDLARVFPMCLSTIPTISTR